MLRVTVTTRHALIDAPAADIDEAVVVAVELIRRVCPVSYARETFADRVSAAIRVGLPIRLTDSELVVIVEVAPTAS